MTETAAGIIVTDSINFSTLQSIYGEDASIDVYDTVFVISGGALGGTAAAYSAHGKFESVGSVIRRMDDAKRKVLYNQAMTIFNKFSVTDIVTLNALMAGEMAIRADLIGVVIEHLHDSLALEVQK